jgi:hypothetical protein
MRTRIIRQAIRGSMVGLVVATVAGAGTLARAQTKKAASSPAGPDLAAVKAALRKYEDPYVAVHDGYFSTVGCVEIEKPGAPGHMPYKPGAMGVHFLNGGLIGPVADPAKPQVLLYEPDGQKLRLVGAEWFVPLSTGVKSRPILWGHPFDGPMMGHPPLLPMELSHYDLHVWLYKSNPLGQFAPTNPNVKCTGHPYRVAEEAPALVPEPKP